MGKDRSPKVLRYIKDERPMKLKSYVKKHRLCLAEIVNIRGQTLLHVCCQSSCGDVLKFLLHSRIDPRVQDRDGNLALHIALQRAKAEPTGVLDHIYTQIVLPMMEACPGSLDVRSVSGTTPRQLLDALVQKRQDYLAQQEFTIPSFDASHPAGNNRDEEWERKLREEEEQDYSTNWGNYEADFYETDASRSETYDEWADRIGKERHLKHQYSSRSSNTTNRDHRSSRKPKEEPRESTNKAKNLEDDREILRSQYKETGSADRVKRLTKRKVKYESMFQKLSDETFTESLRFQDVPWPAAESTEKSIEILFHDVSKSNETLYKKYLREQQVRWHPDKFFQKFGNKIRESDKDEIMSRVNELSQALNKLNDDVAS